MCSLAHIAQRHVLGCHRYGSDTQLYLLLARQTKDSTLQVVAEWLRLSQQKLKPLKMEVLYLSCSGLGIGISLLVFNGAPLAPAPDIRGLLVLLDASLMVEAEVAATSKSAFNLLWLIRQLDPYLKCSNLATVIHEMVTLRLYNCNVLFP